MANKMLIDAAHPEETRVVVLRGSRVEEFDFEAASKKQLRGNIYLAKVTRVEPSLQAAFIEYGGNRHGFLAFSEIHPDYYQIPVSDRQALMEADAQEEPEEEERKPQRRSRRHRRERPASARRSEDEKVSEAAGPDDEMRSVATDAAQTPPYDDFTPEMIEHAQVMHEKLGRGEAVTEADASVETAGEPSPNAAVEPADAPAPVTTAHLEAEAPVTASQPLEIIEPAIDEPPATSAAPSAVVPEPVPLDGVVTSDAQVDTGSTEVAPESTETEESYAQHGAEGRAEQHDDESEEGDDEEDVSEHVEQLGGDAMEEVPTRAYATASSTRSRR